MAIHPRGWIGAEIIARTSDELPEGAEPLFGLHPDGRLDPVTAVTTPERQDGDTLVLLGPVPQRQADAPPARAPPDVDEAVAEP